MGEGIKTLVCIVLAGLVGGLVGVGLMGKPPVVNVTAPPGATPAVNVKILPAPVTILNKAPTQVLPKCEKKRCHPK